MTLSGNNNANVYFLCHEFFDGEYDIVTDIAVYSTYQKAAEAIERLKKIPKFIDHPDSFEIGEVEIDKDYWQEGFFTY